MREESIIEKSLVEQILDEMFKIVEESGQFDTSTIQKLKQLAKSGDLTNDREVSDAIRSSSEGTL